MDFIDIEPRRETVATARGKPTMLQLTVQPAYALTIHKVQSLTIKIDVHGCLEGVFALGQVYVLASRVTDPENFHLVGLPPEDLLEAVARAWQEAGLDVDECFLAAAAVTKEWKYTPTRLGRDPRVCENVRARFAPTHEEERKVPLKLHTLQQILNPQPKAAEVFRHLLQWIDSCDRASQMKQPAPPPKRVDGTALFPDSEWWLTELERRRPPVDADINMDDEVAYDDDDLTRDAANAWWHGGDSKSSGETDEDSDASLPDGPRVRPPRQALHFAALQESEFWRVSFTFPVPLHPAAPRGATFQILRSRRTSFATGPQAPSIERWTRLSMQA